MLIFMSDSVTLAIIKNRLNALFIILLYAGILPVMNFCKKEEPALPVVLTLKISGITKTSAVSGGNITSDGGGEVTARGVCWNTSTGPTIDNSRTNDGKGTGIFESSMNNLMPGTIYYVKSYATNKAGTTYGFEIAFKTDAITPTLSTNLVTDITAHTAASGGYIVSDAGFGVIERGVCWDTIINPTLQDSHTNDGTGTGNFISYLTELLPNTRYYVRAYATNSGGTAYGKSLVFSSYPETLPIVFNPGLVYSSVADIDGNIYRTIEIDGKTWMAENLKTTKYNDGTPIPLVTADTLWFKLQNPGYCWMNNDEATFKDMYGAIYNYFTVITGKLCPAGWHVSTVADWDALTNFLGGKEVAGGKLKETGTYHWKTPNAGAVNTSGFTAIPGGQRYMGSFSAAGYLGRWWCSELWAVKRLQYNNAALEGAGCDAVCGYSVRCVKDD